MKRILCVFLSLLLCVFLLLPAGATVRGDADGDGKLTAADARAALRQSVALESFLPGSLRFQAADADGNGTVTSADARILLRSAVGLKNEEAPEAPGAEAITREFSLAQMGFALSLLKFETASKKNENVLLSPLSAAYALAMTANGAAGNTQQELLSALGVSDLGMLNSQLYSLSTLLPEDERCSLTVANSLWVNRSVQALVQPSFLRTNLQYYGAGVNVCDFDNAALPLINGWVNEHTHGMIKKILEEADPEILVLLLNALCMEAEWQRPFPEAQVRPGDFSTADGRTVNVKMMNGSEYRYLEDETAIGFLKPYVGGDLQFAAILPKDANADIGAFVSSLDGKSLSGLLQNAAAQDVTVQLPKFSFDYDTSLKPALFALGVRDLFSSSADLSAMLAKNAHADDVLQKTFIDVNSKGTRAAAVTAVIVKETAFRLDAKEVVLDRPFLFVITAGETCVPVFIGVVCDPS